MESKNRDKLLSVRNFAEAKPILESLNGGKLSPTAEELMRTAYSVGATQPEIKEQFIGSFIQEVEGKVDGTGNNTDSGESVKPKDGSVSGKNKETDGGKSHGPTTTGELPDLTTDEEVTGADNAVDTKDQMNNSVSESFGQPGMMPMPGQQKPMDPQMQQMMQYTIKETIRFIKPHFDKMARSVQALDKKIQETEKANIKELSFGDRIGKPHPKLSAIKETTGKSPELAMNEKRGYIADYDRALSENKAPSPYQ